MIHLEPYMTYIGGYTEWEFSVGIEMQFQYRYQALIWLCISIDIEILFHAIKCNIFAPTDPQVIKNLFANLQGKQNWPWMLYKLRIKAINLYEKPQIKSFNA